MAENENGGADESSDSTVTVRQLTLDGTTAAEQAALQNIVRNLQFLASVFEQMPNRNPEAWKTLEKELIDLRIGSEQLRRNAERLEELLLQLGRSRETMIDDPRASPEPD
jgi:hypothetical protein